ncbi:hypothetical protein DPEC_G00231140 [Dallia pectoralis]|uniref:Uncharacterized protein n=1 Tax=Dallia pectoralis TaxID=75939 RepID=A0ACC2FWS8_DALPE|nr:hypothetical protein DPEC_G00231140 [Dallia pectoralis]
MWTFPRKCSRLLVDCRQVTVVSQSDIRVGCPFAFYHWSQSLLRPKDSGVKPAESWRFSAVTSSGLRQKPGRSEEIQYKGQFEDIQDDSDTTFNRVKGSGIPQFQKRKPNAHSKWSSEPQIHRDRKTNTGTRVSSEQQREPQIHRDRKTNTGTRVSSELRNLSFDDFPEERERPVKDSKLRQFKDKERNYETLFGVSPCLLALTQGRRKSHRLFVKQGEGSGRASILQVYEAAHQQGVQIQRVSKTDLNKMCSGGVHQGLCLQASPLGYLTEDKNAQPLKESSGVPLWLVLDRVQDPMNLGAILRSAYFLGVDRVACSLQYSCPLTPVVSKASSGVMEIMGVYGYNSLTDMIQVSKGVPRLAGRWHNRC